MGEKSGGSEGTGYDFWFDGIPLICIVSVGKFLCRSSSGSGAFLQGFSLPPVREGWECFGFHAPGIGAGLAGPAIKVIAGGVVGFIGWLLLQSYIISCRGQ
jgi:hypothetical protein